MSKEIIPINETSIVPIRWTEGSLYFVTNKYTINRIAEPLPATSIWKCNVLDEEGGEIIGEVEVVLVSDGSDSLFSEKRTIAQLQGWLDAYDAETGPLPGFYELFYSADGTVESFRIWWKGPILISRSGKPAP
jgi:hypothetical protein